MTFPPVAAAPLPPEGGAADDRAKPGRGGCWVWPLRVVTSSLVAAALAIGVAAPAAAATWYAPWTWLDREEAPLANVVRDPHYGDTLFHFFQDHYFSSVTGLMVSQHFERMPSHADEAEVLRGGLLLSYGLHREAGQIFAQLIEKGAAPAVRDRAWYYLAKIRYQRGFLAEAEAALARIEGTLPGDLQDDRLLLASNLLMARGDYAGAAALLAGVTATKDGKQAARSAVPYLRFNLGVALVKSGDPARGAALLDELGRMPGPNEEIRSLRDKANVALGYTALQENRAEDARTALERVRLNGLQSNKALLGFGWAAATLKQPKLALVPWAELAGRDPGDAAVLEARIALPYAYAELGAYGQALDGYNEAIAAFDQEGGKLDESIRAIRAGKLVDGLIENNPGEEMGWFWKIDQLPEMPHASHLTQVLAQHEFQEAFKNFRDLRYLERNLGEWQDKLGVFGDMLVNRRQAYAERLPKVLSQAGALNIDALKKQRDTLAAELAEAESRADGVAFADAKQAEQRARLAEVQQQLQALGSDAAYDRARQHARLAAGVLTWQLAQDYPARVWEAKKALRDTDRQIDEARTREAALVQAQRDEPARFDRFEARIKALSPTIQALIPRVQTLAREQQNVVQELAVAELQGQKERLVVYATQARFALAQLYDRAKLARENDRASPQ